MFAFYLVPCTVVVGALAASLAQLHRRRGGRGLTVFAAGGGITGAAWLAAVALLGGNVLLAAASWPVLWLMYAWGWAIVGLLARPERRHPAGAPDAVTRSGS